MLNTGKAMKRSASSRILILPESTSGVRTDLQKFPRVSQSDSPHIRNSSEHGKIRKCLGHDINFHAPGVFFNLYFDQCFSSQEGSLFLSAPEIISQSSFAVQDSDSTLHLSNSRLTILLIMMPARFLIAGAKESAAERLSFKSWTCFCRVVPLCVVVIFLLSPLSILLLGWLSILRACWRVYVPILEGTCWKTVLKKSH